MPVSDVKIVKYRVQFLAFRGPHLSFVVIEVDLYRVRELPPFRFEFMTLTILDKLSNVFGSGFDSLFCVSFLVESTVLPIALSLSYDVNLCQIGFRATGSHTFNDWYAPTFLQKSPTLLGQRANICNNRSV